MMGNKNHFYTENIRKENTFTNTEKTVSLWTTETVGYHCVHSRQIYS